MAQAALTQSKSLSYLHPMVFGDSLAQGMSYQEARAHLADVDLKDMPVHSRVGKPFAVIDAQMRDAYANGKIPKNSTIVLFAGMNDLTALTSPVWDALSSAKSREERMENALLALESKIDSFLRFATDNGLRVVLATLPPCKEHKSLRHLKKEFSPDSMQKISEFNRFLASRRSDSIKVIDLSVLAITNLDGSKGDAMKHELTRDGLHPNPEGYKIVMDLLIKALMDFS